MNLESIDHESAYLPAPLSAKVQSLNADLAKEISSQISIQLSSLTLELMKLERLVSDPKNLIIQKYIVTVNQQVNRGHRLAFIRYSQA